jgi:uncharacterized C2H2 Zn-finger protein
MSVIGVAGVTEQKSSTSGRQQQHGFMLNQLRCPRCGRLFKSERALSTHQRMSSHCVTFGSMDDNNAVLSSESTTGDNEMTVTFKKPSAPAAAVLSSESTTGDNEMTVTFKKPSAPAARQKERCPNCGLFFVNLANHRKCKSVIQPIDSHQISSSPCSNSALSGDRKSAGIDTCASDVEPDSDAGSEATSEQLGGNERHFFHVRVCIYDVVWNRLQTI